MKILRRYNALICVSASVLYLISMFVLFGMVDTTSSVSAAETVTIQPAAEGKDTYVFGGSNLNFGASSYFNAGGGTGSPPPLRSLVQFDLSSIPAGATISSATLGVYYYASFGAMPNQAANVPLHKVTSDWNENTANWFVQPTFDASPVTTVTIGDSSAYGWYSYNISSLVQSWKNGSAENYGVLLNYADPTLSTAKTFYSSDEAVNTSLRPKLTVVYSLAAPEPEIQYHKSCVSGSCVNVEGTGSDSCSSNSQCAAPDSSTPVVDSDVLDNIHKVCSSGSCVSAAGEGADECQNDLVCTTQSVEIEVGEPEATDSEEVVVAEAENDEEPTTVANIVEKAKENMNPMVPLIPLAVAGILSLASILVTVWSSLSAELTAKEYLLTLINYIMVLFGAKKKNKQGKVYDSTTKKPIKGALVNMYAYPEMRLVSSAVTDSSGNFYFIAKKGKYVFGVTSRGFVFPSQSAKNDLLIAKNLYVGQTIELGDAGVLNYDIPLDPSSELSSNTRGVLKRIIVSNVPRLAIMTIGTVVSTYLLISMPTNMNYIVLFAYLFLWIIELLVESREIRFSRVVESKKGKPIDLALVRVATKEGKLVQTYVSDYQGRVAIKTNDASDKIMIERTGYQKREIECNIEGFVEGKRFELDKIIGN